MEELFDKPILDQMYWFRKEDFEQYIYDKNKEIQEIEGRICDNAEALLQFFNGLIQDEKLQEKFKELLQNYELSFSNEVDFWYLSYYKLGMNDMHKLKREFNPNDETTAKGETFIDYMDGELDEHLQDKIGYDTPAYKAYKAKNREINKKYPRVIQVFEDSTPILLNQKVSNFLGSVHCTSLL